MSRLPYRIEHLVGWTDEEIAARWKPLNSAEDAREAITEQGTSISRNIVVSIVNRAKEGDLDSIKWSEERGAVILPNSDQPVPEEHRDVAVSVLKAVFRNAEKGDLNAVEWLERRGFHSTSDRQSDEHSEPDSES